ncbi:hypothetical protein KP509_1Z089000 [Ceratopteris richardii]|nr:hypothetical protein KP509_1Z089000 [Ceratopteris richardii]
MLSLARPHGYVFFTSVYLRKLCALAAPLLDFEDRRFQNCFNVSDPLHAFDFSNSADILLQKCTSLQPGDLSSCRHMLASLAYIGLDSLPFAADHLIRFFSFCGNLQEADVVFSKVARPTLYTWNSIISAHSDLGDGSTCIAMYVRLQKEGLKPDKCTFFAVLKACSVNLMILEGRLIHNLLVLCAITSVELLGITLMDMYAKGGYLEDAHRLFQHLPVKDLVSYNIMISAYAQSGHGYCALELYEELALQPMSPNSITYACILKVCCDLCEIKRGMKIHSDLIKLGLDADVFVGSGVLHMHAKFGSLQSAEKVFFKISRPNVVSWNVLLKAYTHSKVGYLVYQAFERMQHEGIQPDEVTFLYLAQYCSDPADIYLGKLIFNEIIKRGFDRNILIINTVIDMYIKMGELEEGCDVFNRLKERDVVSWNVMLMGYVEQGNVFSMLTFLGKMQSHGIKANGFTYACVVKACCDAGSMSVGKLIHERLVHENIEIDLVLGNVLIEMYAKCGCPEIAHVILDDLPAPTVSSWNALISGYALCGNTYMVNYCLRDMKSHALKPNSSTLTSVITACSHAGQVKLGAHYFYLLQEDYDIETNIDHYNTLVDLLCRTGFLKEAEALFQTMPSSLDASGRTSLLSGQTKYGDIMVE